MNDFYRHRKLRTYFRGNTKVREQTEKEIFKKPSNKMWVPNENHHTIETFIEATKNGVKDERKTMCIYIKQRKYRHNKYRGAVVTFDVKDYIKESETQLTDTYILKRNLYTLSFKELH